MKAKIHPYVCFYMYNKVPLLNTLHIMNALDYFHTLGEKNADLKLSKMFGAECFKTANGKAAAIIYHNDLVVKLEPVELEDALCTKGSKMFEPMEGRPMNGWVIIPYARKNEWQKYLELATEYVKALPAKPQKPKKRKE